MILKEKKPGVKSLVSIIIPVYNREDLLFETLDSVHLQIYQNWECILVDDGSEESTKKAIEKYLVKDTRFRYVNRPKNREKGANACRNYGFEISQGEYINWFDSDDIMHPEMIGKKVEAFQQNDQMDFVDCKIVGFKYNIDKMEDLIDLPQSDSANGEEFDDIIHKRNWFITFGPMFKRSFLQKIDLFNESIQKSQERDFFLRIFAFKEPKYYRIPEQLVYYREHDNRVTFLELNKVKKYIDEADSYHKTYLSIRNSPKFKKDYHRSFFNTQVTFYWVAMRSSYNDLRKRTWLNLKQYFRSNLLFYLMFGYYFTKYSLKRGWQLLKK